MPYAVQSCAVNLNAWRALIATLGKGSRPGICKGTTVGLASRYFRIEIMVRHRATIRRRDTLTVLSAAVRSGERVNGSSRIDTFGSDFRERFVAVRFSFAIIRRMAVTRRQKEVLDFLESFVTRNGYSPSFEEIARGMGLKSLATVHKHITNLEKKGMLDRVHNRSRSIDVLPPGARTRSSDRLPLAGRIAAGLPVETSEQSESISLHDVVGNRDVFALEVRGDSMRDEHIISGDYVLVERTRTARQGEIVVALVHGAETTLKRFYSEGSVIRLQPSNVEMEPIYVPAAQVAIQGRVLGVLRKYH
jgi:repressor LexA